MEIGETYDHIQTNEQKKVKQRDLLGIKSNAPVTLVFVLSIQNLSSCKTR